jgi:ubiquinone/menaquinone biosynthesis C-methylase UbiE
MPDRATINDEVRSYWEDRPCGTSTSAVGAADQLTQEWFDRIERSRYFDEPFIPEVAQFRRHRGRRVLEVGVGAGTDHLQFARAGAICHGVDLTQAAINLTSRRLEVEGLASDLRRVDAEELPFDDDAFDVVYSWGVIHHSDKPKRIVEEIHRVLRPGGEVIAMMYKRRSLYTLRLWVRHALLRGKPWMSFADVLWNHMESVGTKGYTYSELRALFGQFEQLSLDTIMTGERKHRFLRFVPDALGFFIVITAVKPAPSRAAVEGRA